MNDTRRKRARQEPTSRRVATEDQLASPTATSLRFGLLTVNVSLHRCSDGEQYAPALGILDSAGPSLVPRAAVPGVPDSGRHPDSGTRSASPAPRLPSDPRHRPYLFLVLESHQPLAPPLRLSLHDLDEIVTGRGRARQSSHRTSPVRQLDLRLEDAWLSSKHMRLSRLNRRWVLEDTDSKNGSFVNGVEQKHAELQDGDLIEIGHTFFLFRTTVESEPDDPPRFDASPASASIPGLSTMLPALSRVFENLARIARSDIPVLLEGEPGTGKEVLARAIHAISARPREFVAVNCGALPRDLMEAELFGHRKGTFTGATEDRPGLVRAADRGTLFLDEIGDLPLQAQTTLLRVLQEREVRPVGDTRTIKVDLRLVAATNRPLERMVEAGTFRADLFGRLAGHRVELPPLRERREDIGLLLGTMLQRHADPTLLTRIAIQPQAARAMLQYDWPGNVRELEKAIETGLVLAGDKGMIDLGLLPKAVQRALEDTAATRGNEDAVHRAELVELLRQHEGNIAAVARAMGKARMQIQRWLKRYGIDAESFRL